MFDIFYLNIICLDCDIILKYNTQPISNDISKWKANINLNWEGFKIMYVYVATILTVDVTVYIYIT